MPRGYRPSLLGDEALNLTPEQEYARAEEELKRKVENGEISETQAKRLMTRRKMKMRQGKAIDGDAAEGKSKAMEAADFQSTQMMLDQLLAKDDSNWFLDWCLEVSGYNWMEDKVKRENMRRLAEDFKHPFPATELVINSNQCEVIMGVVMALNAFMIGFQVSVPLDPTNKADQDVQTSLEILDQLFTLIFTGEIVGHVMADGWPWLWSMANMFDVVVIGVTNVIPMWLLLPLDLSDRAIRPFAVLRMIRLLKLCKLIRKYRQFAILWDLMAGLMNSLQTLMYAVIVLSCALYILSVFCVNFLARHESLMEDDFTQDHFGNVSDSWFTLFQILTLDSWSSIVRPIAKTTIAAYITICGNIVVGEMVLCNLVTAVICEQAQSRSAADEEIAAVEAKEKKDGIVEDLKELFEDIDEDGSGRLSQEEFLEACEVEEDVMYKLMALGVEDVQELWELMDNGTGELSIAQFASRLKTYIGEALSKDTFAILRRHAQAGERADYCYEALLANRSKADELLRDIKKIHLLLANATKDLHEWMQLIRICIPSQPQSLEPTKIDKWRDKVKYDHAGLPRPFVPVYVDDVPLEKNKKKKFKPKVKASMTFSGELTNPRNSLGSGATSEGVTLPIQDEPDVLM